MLYSLIIDIETRDQVYFSASSEQRPLESNNLSGATPADIQKH